MTFMLVYGALKNIFGFLGYLVLPWQRVCQGVLEICLKISFHMFPYNDILKVFKSKIGLDI